LTLLQGIHTFLDANGCVFYHDHVEVVCLRVRNAREAIQFLGPVRWNGLDVGDYDRLDLLATAGFMVTDMIVDNLTQEVESRAVDPEHVESLCTDGGFIQN
jgi:hypothetical protein